MKKIQKFLPIVLIVFGLLSCDLSSQILGGRGVSIKPGDKIGEMIVEQSNEIPNQNIRYFCEYMDVYEPFSASTDCEVPLVSRLDISLGWMAKESKFESNWKEITWELYVDDKKIDLEAFDWFDSEFKVKGEDNKQRAWVITLKNLAPGVHTLKQKWKSRIAIDDGWNVYQAGEYQQTVNFTVLEKEVYPVLSSKANIGLHPHTSEKAQLDFIFYLPNDYGKDPQREWPLIIYLHGASFRGTTLGLLKEESLLRRLEIENKLPFIVVSPLGDGEYEFWRNDELINSIFTLLAEIQSLYSIDEKRIYLTGNDMGGNGVWEIALRHPQIFAALAPISGYFGWPPEIPENICDLKEVPVWAFHGGRDDIIPVEAGQELVDALNACGGNAKYTIRPDMKIDVRFNVYSDPDLFEWFLLQSRK